MSLAGWVRILPFAVFMLFIALQQGLGFLLEQSVDSFFEQHLLYLYPLKIIVVVLLLLVFRRHYTEIHLRDLGRWRSTLMSLVLGLLVFVLWINMDWDFAFFGESAGFDPGVFPAGWHRGGMILVRLAGAAIVVPVMEELFWRSFLLRYIIKSDFESVRIGTYSLASFVIGALLFGFEHHLVLAGIMAGACYSLLLYRTKSLIQCIFCHGVTNLALGIYVLYAEAWTFW